jgi:hypothetical protein
MAKLKAWVGQVHANPSPRTKSLRAEADRQGNIIPPSGEPPADPRLPRALRLPPQATHAIEVYAGEPQGFRGIRIKFKTPPTD